ncbi:MAG: hypothetical protein LC687_03510 [Actinobacteria bacterium]|nr:hypothetical protein [Actinomycetota bacterium]
MNEFKIANSMFVNTTEVNKFSGTVHQGHVATGNASISASVNESAPVLTVFGMSYLVLGVPEMVVPSGGQHHCWSTRCPAVMGGVSV